MPSRLRLYDCRLSRLPTLVGLCVGNVPGISGYVNTAQRRLVFAKEAGDEGWNGTWAEMVFHVDPSNPYITTPREVARIEGMTVCDRPVPIQNQFYEYLQFGNGTLPKKCSQRGCQNLEGYSKNNVPTFVDLSVPSALIRVYITNAADIGKRMLVQGLDGNKNPYYSQDNFNRVLGQFEPFASPFTTWPMQFSAITGIQKDVTSGQVQVFQVDPATGIETLLLTMEPSEQTAWYRRYLLNPIPRRCCHLGTGTVQVKALAKLDIIPVQVDTDYCLLTNLEAIIEECQSVRYSEIDTPGAKQMSKDRHLEAIRMLNGELTHYLGTNSPAISVKPFGSASLERVGVGMM
jgi:hypothetical protein